MYDAALKSDLKQALAQHGLRANKKLGQNFLCDKNMADAIVAACGDLGGLHVLEIGPGAGALTGRLCAAARGVHAIELDGGLYRLLLQQMHFDNLTLINADALKYDIAALSPQPDAVVANLPYYITTALINRLLDDLSAKDMTLMMQREVCDRLAAPPGSKVYGSLSVAVQYRCQVQPLMNIPGECFYPSPEVESTLLRLHRRPYPLQPKDEAAMLRLVRIAFAMRRKTIRNNLTSAGIWNKSHISLGLERAGIDPASRAETLSVDDFIRLSDALGEIY